MSKAMQLIIALVVVIIIVVGAIFVFGKKKAASPSSSATTTSSQSVSDTTSTSTTITYDGSRFEPQTLTVKVGTKIKIVNQSSSAQLGFDSDPHPTHTNEQELNIGSIDPGVSGTFTVTKVGAWGYHNHLHPDQTGTIVVTN